MAEKQLDLKEITNLLKGKNCVCFRETDLFQPFELNAEDFIRFAQQDLAGNSEREMVNALSNTNRAIHCRIDELLFSLNLQPFSSKEGWSHKRKVRFLQDFGIHVDDVLRKLISDLRNQLEHQYVKPRNQVQDALAVAQYFLEATDRYLDGGTKGAIVGLYIEAGKWPEEEKVPARDDYANPDDYENALDDSYAILAEPRPELYRVFFNYRKHTIGITHSSILTGQRRSRKLYLPQDCSKEAIIEFRRTVRQVSSFIYPDELMRVEQEFDSFFQQEETFKLLDNNHKDG